MPGFMVGIIKAMKEQRQETRNTGTITISRAEYDAFMEAKSQNEWLREQLRLLKKKQFGASSEQTKEPLDGQMSLLFNEAEAYAAPPGPQPSRSPAKRAQLGEEGQGSGMRNARRAFRIRADFAPTRWSTACLRKSGCARSAES